MSFFENNTILISILSIVFLGSISSWGLSLEPDKITRQLIESRIKSSHTICVKGEACAKNAYIPPQADREPMAAAAIYKKYCTACHENGAFKAVKINDKAVWKKRLDEAKNGYKGLLEIVITGIGLMPPKGLCTDCSDEELEATIRYMVEFDPAAAK
ncbi:MAG: cytochrome c5 family protein [Endozoicomonadaceae bacterium]|nr:cytochrome c5 family protein [Endozoicomonadaceae bacterium]